jgi:hypothetical protein
VRGPFGPSASADRTCMRERITWCVDALSAGGVRVAGRGPALQAPIRRRELRERGRRQDQSDRGGDRGERGRDRRDNHDLDAFDHDFTIDELDVQLLSGANEVVEGTFDATAGTHVLSCVVLTLNPDTPRRGWRER